ncbi:MAG TPA: hypothetical protein VFV40_07670 [Nocardioides sp.]|nr:hypothetical protein [Nocardioides sp.]
MTPLQGIAMGLVIVLVDAPFGGYDGVPDPAGWLLVLWGLARLRAVPAQRGGLLVLAVLCLVVSVATYPPQVSERLDASGGWALSLPQLAFCVALASALGPVAASLEGRLRVMRAVFVALAIAPAVVIGGDLDALRSPLALVVAAANVYFVYLLFQASGRVTPQAGSPQT